MPLTEETQRRLMQAHLTRATDRAPGEPEAVWSWRRVLIFIGAFCALSWAIMVWLIYMVVFT